ncbi:MAG: DUF2470 domain-containing protein [Gloeomargarita sp. SKYBB_i_bin120]|nr:DUF2470 domain-containing protein [Gloeomargarita sp. SKYG98]MCS7292215.1 DUF2470 domain-containing protein [Gloeomargarita sp. SKYB120]MDW8177776.1 DUF2470 domain-containing protein [Gloeomargarita sp. SKYBB_i_bin120]
MSGALPSDASFPAEVSARICRHMNRDHPDAVLLYAQGLAGMVGATAATMEAIDCRGMDLQVWEGDTPKAIRIEFPEPLSGPKAAHHCLVQLVEQARQRLASQ